MELGCDFVLIVQHKLLDLIVGQEILLTLDKSIQILQGLTTISETESKPHLI